LDHGCPQCKAENPQNKNFCSDCGSLLTPRLAPFVRTQVEEYVRQNLKERNVVEIETSEAVAGRVLKWAKLYYAVPVAILLAILALFGVSDYSDFHKTVRRATDELEPKLSQAITEADAATNKAQEAQARSSAPIKAIDAATSKMNAQLALAEQLSTKVTQLEDRNTAQIAKASKHVEDRVTELDKRVEGGSNAITEQQAKLTSTNELVTAMFSKGLTDWFSTTEPTSKSVVSSVGQKGATVYMLLKSAPIFQTVQIQFHVYTQPKGSYGFKGNLLVFRWGDAAEGLKQHPLQVSYVPDPTYHGPLYSALSVKDGKVFGDGEQLGVIVNVLP
jgi:hypothetical protein